jgi:hypothetical protein
MIRYWFEFENNVPYGMKIGCGVTAYSYSDALNILKDKVFKDSSQFQIKRVIEDVDVSTLDPGHVLPNMSPPNLRGIWFPQGYN